MKKQQIASPRAISNTQLKKAELLHILGGFGRVDEDLNFTEAKCQEGCRKACKDGCKGTAK